MLDPLARLVRGDRLAERVDRCDVLAVDRDDHVARRAGSSRRRRRPACAALEPGLGGRAAGLHGADEDAVVGREPEHVRDLRVDVLQRDAEVGAVDAAVVEQLRDDALDGVGRNREADADVAAAAVARLDLRVDADHAALRVDQRAARVAAVDRRVGLDHVVDGEVVRRAHLALQRADDPGRDGALEPERVPDRDDRVTDLDVVGVGQRERRQRLRRRRRPSAGRDRWTGRCRPPWPSTVSWFEKLTSICGGALDDVVVRDDVALLVDHEARAERAAATAPDEVPEGVAACLRRRGRGDLDDAGPAAAVDLRNVDRGRPGGRRTWTLCTIGAASTTGVSSSNAPSTQAPPSAAQPPRRAAAASAASGLAADAARPGAAGVASWAIRGLGEVTPRL